MELLGSRNSELRRRIRAAAAPCVKELSPIFVVFTAALTFQVGVSGRMVSPPVVISATAKHSATIIFLHGLGDTGHGWASAISSIRPPYMKVVCPTAHTIPVSINNGFQMPSWFDIKGLEATSPEDEDGIKKAATFVHGMIDKEIAEGIPSERIIVGGFSQGGALAIYSALTCNKKLAAIVALSCWFPLYKQFTPGAVTVNRNIPVLQCHGNCDPIVSYKLGQLTASAVKNFTEHSEFKTYNGLMHSSSDEEMEDVQNFIKKWVPSL